MLEMVYAYALQAFGHHRQSICVMRGQSRGGLIYVPSSSDNNDLLII